jgi:hypothetical protein
MFEEKVAGAHKLRGWVATDMAVKNYFLVQLPGTEFRSTS